MFPKNNLGINAAKGEYSPETQSSQIHLDITNRSHVIGNGFALVIETTLSRQYVDYLRRIINGQGLNVRVRSATPDGIMFTQICEEFEGDTEGPLPVPSSDSLGRPHRQRLVAGTLYTRGLEWIFTFREMYIEFGWLMVGQKVLTADNFEVIHQILGARLSSLRMMPSIM